MMFISLFAATMAAIILYHILRIDRRTEEFEKEVLRLLRKPTDEGKQP